MAWKDIVAETLGGLGKEIKQQTATTERLLADVRSQMITEGKAARVRYDQQSEEIRNKINLIFG